MKLFILIILCLFPFTAYSHVGAVPTVYQGKAGGYSTTIVVMPTTAVPGFTDISVKIPDSDVKIDKITAVPLTQNEDRSNSINVDNLLPVQGEKNLFVGKIQLMQEGPLKIKVHIEGSKGSALISIPFEAVKTVKVTIPHLKYVIFFFIGFLFFLVAVVAGKGRGEGVVPLGATPTEEDRRKGKLYFITVLAIFIAFLFYDYQFSMKLIEATAVKAAQTRAIEMRVTGDAAQKLSFQLPPEALTFGRPRIPYEDQMSLMEQYTSDQLVPDHGKLIHLFLISKENGRVAHLHPVRTKDHRFETAIPPLPEGNYQVFADITTLSGRTITFSSNITLDKPPMTYTPTDPDDSWADLKNSKYKIVFQNADSINSEEIQELRFEVLDEAGIPQKIENYMGMTGHAALIRNDGTLFAHIHPVGTVSMGSMPMDHSSADMDMQTARDDSKLAFPYRFYADGHYILWVQVKIDGKVFSQKYDINVGDAS